MIKSKFFKAFILGVCLSALSSTAVFAESGSGVSGVSGNARGEVEIYRAEPYIDTGSDTASMQKQREIDMYVFKEHVKDIEEKGFKVTHTSPMDGYVEIGIIPYSEENAAYLYEIFGIDAVKVVEGVQAILAVAPDVGFDGSAGGREPAMAVSGGNSASVGGETRDAILYQDTAVSNEDMASASGMANDDVLYTTANTNAESASVPTIPVMALVAGGAIILLGGMAVVTRRLKTSNR